MQQFLIMVFIQKVIQLIILKLFKLEEFTTLMKTFKTKQNKVIIRKQVPLWFVKSCLIIQKTVVGTTLIYQVLIMLVLKQGLQTGLQAKEMVWVEKAVIYG